MDISITHFRARCLELIRQVEGGGEEIRIRRRGRVVARLTAPAERPAGGEPPWRSLRGSGCLLAEPQESVLDPQAFDAAR